MLKHKFKFNHSKVLFSSVEHFLWNKILPNSEIGENHKSYI